MEFSSLNGMANTPSSGHVSIENGQSAIMTKVNNEHFGTNDDEEEEWH